MRWGCDGSATAAARDAGATSTRELVKSASIRLGSEPWTIFTPRTGDADGAEASAASVDSGARLVAPASPSRGVSARAGAVPDVSASVFGGAEAGATVPVLDGAFDAMVAAGCSLPDAGSEDWLGAVSTGASVGAIDAVPPSSRERWSVWSAIDAAPVSAAMDRTEDGRAIAARLAADET